MPINSILEITITFITIVFGTFVYALNRKDKIGRLFFYLCLSTALWISSNAVIDLSHDYAVAIFLTRLAIIFVAFIPIFFNKLICALYFNQNENYIRKDRLVAIISYIVILVFVLFSQTELNVKSISIEAWGVAYQPGVFYIILIIYLIIAFGFSLLNLLHIYLTTYGQTKNQIRLILIGSTITIAFSILFGAIFPLLSNSHIAVFAPSIFIIFIGFISYAITNHHLFNIKVITIELVTFLLWIFVLIKMLTAENTPEFIAETALFAVALVFGVLLIRSTLHELRQREKILKLTSDLHAAYEKMGGLSLPRLPHPVSAREQATPDARQSLS